MEPILIAAGVAALMMAFLFFFLPARSPKAG
jgi:hypothetical protein